MASYILSRNILGDGTYLTWYGGTDASKPSSGMSLGDLYSANDTGKVYKATSSTVWTELVPATNPTIGTAGITKSSHVITAGTAPTVSGTNLGTGGTVSVAGTDLAGNITISFGAAPVTSSGAVTLTFNSAYVTNNPVIVLSPLSGSQAWGNTSTFAVTTESLSAPVITWSNSVNGALTNVTASATYKIAYLVIGK